MIIGVDIRPMAGPKTGIQEYTEQILKNMILLGSEHKFKLFFSSFSGQAPRRPWMDAPNVELVEYRISSNLLFLVGKIFGYPFIDDLIGGADVFFSPHFFMAPLSKKCRRVTTFHDLSYLRFPNFFTWRKLWWHNVEMSPHWQARFSNHIISVSESTKADLVKFYDIDPVNISVVHSGVNVSRPTENALRVFKKENNLPDRYILHVGTIEPRKNITGLIRAFNILKEDLDYDDVELVLVGKDGWHIEEVLSEIQNSPHKNKIRRLGHVGGDLAPYYGLAKVCVCPSFFEGFGFPVLEAMACGLPVISSATSSLPEVAGNSAIYINPYNVSEIVEALKLVLSSEWLRDKMAKEGLLISNKFSWIGTARQSLAILTRKQ